LKIKTQTARNILTVDGLQVSAEAVEAFAIHLNDMADQSRDRVKSVLVEENERRRYHGLPPRRRIKPVDIERATQR
jgi:hypothetical protein